MAEKKKLVDKTGLAYYHQNTVAPMINATYSLGQSLLAMQEDFNKPEFWAGVGLIADTAVISGNVDSPNDLPSTAKEGAIYNVSKQTFVEDSTGNIYVLKDRVFDYYDLPSDAEEGDVYMTVSPMDAYYKYNGTDWEVVTGVVVPANVKYKYTDGEWEVFDASSSQVVDLSDYLTKEDLTTVDPTNVVSADEASSWFDD